MPPLSTAPKRREITPRMVLIAAVALSMVLLTVWCVEGESGPLHGVRSAVQTVVSPVQRAGSAVAMPFQAIGRAFTNAAASDEEITALQGENERLRSQLYEYEEYKLENERLTALLELSTTYNLQSTGARVISQSADSWNKTITLDKGSSDGISVGMPVMSSLGLVGQVDSVSAASCVVRLITDEQSGVSVVLQNTRTQGILSGSADGLLYLDYVPVDTQVELGEVVVTSGLGGVYPSGIVVGVVSRIADDGDDSYKSIIVSPVANFDLNEEVLILTGDETQAASAADVVDADSLEADGGEGATEGEGSGDGASGEDGADGDGMDGDGADAGEGGL